MIYSIKLQDLGAKDLLLVCKNNTDKSVVNKCSGLNQIYLKTLYYRRCLAETFSTLFLQASSPNITGNFFSKISQVYCTRRLTSRTHQPTAFLSI
jgi:hypothetical protein